MGWDLELSFLSGGLVLVLVLDLDEDRGVVSQWLAPKMKMPCRVSVWGDRSWERIAMALVVLFLVVVVVEAVMGDFAGGLVCASTEGCFCLYTMVGRGVSFDKGCERMASAAIWRLASMFGVLSWLVGSLDRWIDWTCSGCALSVRSASLACYFEDNEVRIVVASQRRASLHLCITFRGDNRRLVG